MSQGKIGERGYRVMDEEDGARMLCLWQGGMSHSQLARAFGVSPGTIRNELARRGADDIERTEGRAHAKGDQTVLGGMGREVVARMLQLGVNALQLSRRAGVDTYHVDQIIYMASIGRVWCPPADEYRKLHDCLWGNGETTGSTGTSA